LKAPIPKQTKKTAEEWAYNNIDGVFYEIERAQKLVMYVLDVTGDSPKVNCIVYNLPLLLPGKVVEWSLKLLRLFIIFI
jgi:hypothetical protein